MIISWLALFLAVGVFGVWLYVQFADLIVAVALAEPFRQSNNLLPWLACAYLIKGVQTVFETRILAQKTNEAVLVSQAAGACTALACYFVLIPRFGAMGAAWGTLIAMAASCLISSWLAQPTKSTHTGN